MPEGMKRPAFHGTRKSFRNAEFQLGASPQFFSIRETVFRIEKWRG
jgi:hypothetical protein